MHTRHPPLPPLLMMPLALVLAACGDLAEPIAPPPATAFDVGGGSCVVTSIGDTGAGTLRAALADGGCSTITFDVTLDGQTIALTSGPLTISHDVDIQGPGADQLTVARSTGAAAFRVFEVAPGTVRISGLTISGGLITDDAGGGLANYGVLTLTESTVSGNQAVGGAVLNLGTLRITKSTISGNEGGGIQNEHVLELTQSTISANVPYSLGAGFGIDNYSNATLTVINSTISGNTGGIRAGLSNPIVSHSTISGNTDFGIALAYSSTTLRNTVVAGNGSANCNITVGGSILDAGYNLEDGTSCGFSVANNSLPDTDPLLAPLGDNGGPTLTHALLVGSPAIDAGTCTGPSGADVTEDQRGISRPQPAGGDCDIGAFELDGRFAFSGFLAPVADQPTVNRAKAGSAVPVKFSLGGDQGLDIFVDGYPQAELVACESSDPEGDVTETVTAGGSSLAYDPTTDEYTYVWKTDRHWKDTCRDLTLLFTDGTRAVASFSFR